MSLAALGIVLLVAGELAIGSLLNEECCHPERWHSQIQSEDLAQRPMCAFRSGTLLFLRHQTLGQQNPWSDSTLTVIARLLQTVWSLLVMASIGGAISRIAAVDVAGRGSGSLFVAFRGSLQRIWPSLMGMIIVAGAVGFLCGMISLGGVVSLIPVLGEFLLVASWIVGFGFGILAVLMGLGMIAGWPIMICTISVEDSDGFDAMGRAFSYLFHHVIYATFLLTVAVVQGTIALLLLTLFVEFTETLTWSLIGLGRLGQTVSPSQFNQFAGLVWMQFVNWIPAAFGLSYFWVAWTQIYFVLRARDDGTPFHMIGGVDPPLDPLPLSGMPAAKRREDALSEPAESDAD